MPIEPRSWINPGFWINLSMLAGDTGEPARRHLRDLEHSVRRLHVTLGCHVTSQRDAELRRETLRLIKQAVAGRDAAARAAV